MKVLGFRSDPNTPRYAIIDAGTNPMVLLNEATESRLCFPAGCESDAARVPWLYREFERIFHLNPDIAKVVIKIGEFTMPDNKARRSASYQEAALILFCGLEGIPVWTKLYASLGTRSNQVKEHAAARVGQMARYWDGKIADAIIAAWWGANHQ